MKTIIAGGRDGVKDWHLFEALEQVDWKITEVVSGGAKGADALGEWYAACELLPLKRFEADWDRFGKSAGPKRNMEMAKYADALIALWDGKSKGTANMIAVATKLNLKVLVYRIDSAA